MIVSRRYRTCSKCKRDKPIPRLAIDQFGIVYHLKTAYPRKELLSMFSRRHADKMYVDTINGPKHIGYVIAGNWLRLYCAWEGSPH